MYKTKIALTMLISVGVISCSAQQDSSKQGQNEQRRNGPPPTAAELMKMDTDGDGLLSKKEIQGPLLNDFDKIDSNKDGFLSEEELEKAPKPERREGPPR